jgi:hypothetical protein
MNRASSGPTLVVLAAGRARRYGGCKPLAPVGPNGEAVLDLLASDALAAGFTTLVLVLSPSTGPAIRYRVERVWSKDLDIRFATQVAPHGTVDAVVAALDHFDPGSPFGACNADDLYVQDAFTLLAGHLSSGSAHNTMVGFSLANAMIGDAPVTRGVCEVSDGLLASITERRQVSPLGGGRFLAKDGLEPSELAGDTVVSVNLWGFVPAMRAVFTDAMAAAVEASEDHEVLLPDLVSAHLRAGAATSSFAVLQSTGRCIGVTHPDDLALVQAAVAREVGRGERPGTLWAARRIAQPAP